MRAYDDDEFSAFAADWLRYGEWIQDSIPDNEADDLDGIVIPPNILQTLKRLHSSRWLKHCPYPGSGDWVFIAYPHPGPANDDQNSNIVVGSRVNALMHGAAALPVQWTKGKPAPKYATDGMILVPAIDNTQAAKIAALRSAAKIYTQVVALRDNLEYDLEVFEDAL